MKTSFAFLGTVLALCLAAQTVKADAIINDWYFTTTTSITDVGGKNDFFTQESDNYITWGDPSNSKGAKSGAILGGNSGTIKTDSTDGATAATFTHINNTLKLGTGGVNAMTIQLGISLSDTSDFSVGSDFSSITLDPLVLKMGFYETPNSTTKNGKIYEEDIFYLLDSGSVIEQEFSFNGNNYLVTLVSVLNELEGVYLEMAQERLGVDSGTTVYGWTTAESSTNPTTFPFTITVSTISTVETQNTATPEPATMLIFGLAGIAGLPIAKRIRKK